MLASIPLLAQTNGRPALGSLQTQGSVFVEGMPVTPGTSLYPGDTLRTGPDGAANLNLPDRGSFTISANTEITFVPNQPGAQFAALHQGSIAFRLRAEAPGTTIEVGKFVLTTEPNTEAAAEVVMSADGSAHVRCLAGSVGIIALEGVQVIFLQPGQEAETAADGRVRRVAPGALPPSTSGRPGQPTSATGKSHIELIILGVGAGLGGAVAALVATRHGQPVSPATP